MVRAYREGYTLHVEKLTKDEIDALDPSLTRFKTEIDEIQELLDSVKKKGSASWGSVRDLLESALDKLTENYHAVIHDGST